MTLTERAGALAPDRPAPGGRGAPLVVGHRGASGYRPEHTLASYELAARLGADSLEPDLVASRDGVLVCSHDLELSRTTDIASRREFADRRRTRVVQGRRRTGWFACDLSARELKTLRVRERFAGLRRANTVYDGRLPMTTFDELLALRERLSTRLGRPIGLSPELKHPQWHRRSGLDLERPLAAALRRAGLDAPDAPVYVQTFEPTSLHRLRAVHGLRTPTILLAEATGGPADLAGRASYDELLAPTGLTELATWLTGIGPAKDRVVPRAPDGTLSAPTALVRDAHAAGLRVHVWTFRAENAFLPTELRSSGADADFGDVLGEMGAFLRAGADALITDHSELAARARLDARG